jgi:hypothetical protein
MVRGLGADRPSPVARPDPEQAGVPDLGEGENQMKLVARIATAFALLAFATPALPCGANKTKTTTATSEAKKEQPVAKAAEAPKTEQKAEKKATVKVKAPAETKTATAN